MNHQIYLIYLENFLKFENYSINYIRKPSSKISDVKITTRCNTTFVHIFHYVLFFSNQNKFEETHCDSISTFIDECYFEIKDFDDKNDIGTYKLVSINHRYNISDSIDVNITAPRQPELTYTSLEEHRQDDKEVVQDDSFIMKFSFDHLIYDVNSLIYLVPNENCLFKNFSNQTESMFSYFLVFLNVTQACSGEFNFTIQSVSLTSNEIQDEETHSLPVDVKQWVRPVFINENLTSYSNVTITKKTNIEQTYDVKTYASNHIDLSCEIISKPRPNIIWTKDNETINTKTKDERYSFHNGSSILRIQHSKREDSGIYMCVVTNRYKTISRTFNIDANINEKIIKLAIIVISFCSSILFILLLVIAAYAVYQKIKNNILIVTV